MAPNKMRPIHPGEILREEYLIPLELSVNALAQNVAVWGEMVSTRLANLRAICIQKYA